MKKILKISSWIIAGLIGLLLYFTFPEAQNFVAVAAGIGFAYFLVSELVESAVKKVITQELGDFRRRNYSDSEKIDAIERKVSMLLRDALERRRAD